MSHWYDGWTAAKVFAPEVMIAGILALIAIYFGWRGPAQRERKVELSFGVIGQQVVAGTAHSMVGKAVISYEGQEVSRLSRVLIAIMNTGDLTLRKENFESDLTIPLSGATKLFSARVFHSYPSTLAPTVVCKDHEVVIPPLLLNVGDYLIIEVILENSERVGGTLCTRLHGSSAFPVLRAGAHPGYDTGGLIFYGLLFLFGLGAACYQLSREKYLDALWPVMSLLLFVVPLVAYTRGNIVKRRLRFMGEQTREFAEVEGIPSM